METVKQFGNELNSILDFRPPVSRAKMGSITKLAMKSHRYYKHIVMVVEKFITKSSSEYKVPGLYVIDSIMRQSRHQFGAKDSFGPRFTKNFEKTFLHLFQCPEEDKPKIVRVLNLWQKNEVFPPEVIQPLLALASTDVTHGKPRSVERNRDKSLLSLERHQDRPHLDPDKAEEEEPGNNQNLDLSTATTIIQQQQEQITALLQQQHQLQTQATSLLGPALSSVLVQQQQQASSGGVQQLEALSSLLQQTQQLQQLQAMQQRLTNGGGESSVGGVPAQISNVETIPCEDQPPLFNEAVLNDFDYSDDEEDSLDRASRLARQREGDLVPQPPPQLMHENELGSSPARSSPLRRENMEQRFPQPDVPLFQRETIPHPSLVGANKEGSSFPREMANNPPLPPSSETFSPAPPPNHPSPFPRPPGPHNAHSIGPPPSQIPPGPPPHHEWSRQHPPLPPHFLPPPRSPSPRMKRESRFSSPPPMLRRSPSPPPHHRQWRERERERDSRWGTPPRRRSRSPPMHPHRHSRDRSRSPPPRWHRVTTPPENQERRRRGIPFPRENHMTVCSTTLWVGHLSKLATKDTVKEAFEDFGQVKSVELVQARGCAYLVMVHRNDAIRALNSLRDLKLGGSICKLAWAPGRGVKGAGLKAFWDQEVGSSYIPWSFVKSQSDVDTMGDGGWIDAVTVPPGFNLPQPPRDEESMDEDSEAAGDTVQMDLVQPQQPPQPPIQNVFPPSLPPQQNLPPTPTSLPPQPPVNVNPPIPSFPQLMNPAPSFQVPRGHFPPRGIPNSQPMPVQPPPQPVFSQPNGVPFHGNIRPPMGEPQPGMPQQLHRPPVISGPPHSMAPHMGGVPPHSMGGVPQMPMHRPQMATSMPQHPHGMLPQPQMMQTTRPFVPNMGRGQPPMLSPVGQMTHTFPQQVPQHPMGGEPFRPLMSSRIGEVPRSGHLMAPRIGEGPRPTFAPNMLQQPMVPVCEHQPPLPLSVNEPLIRPPLPTSQGMLFQPTSIAGQPPPLMAAHLPIPPTAEKELLSFQAPLGEDQKQPSQVPLPVDEEPKEASVNQISADNEPKESLTAPPPVDEEPKETLPAKDVEPLTVPGTLDEEPKEPFPIQPPMTEEPSALPLTVDEEPKEPFPPHTDDTPMAEPSVPMDKISDETPPQMTRDSSEHCMDEQPSLVPPQKVEESERRMSDDSQPTSIPPRVEDGPSHVGCEEMEKSPGVATETQKISLPDTHISSPAQPSENCQDDIATSEPQTKIHAQPPPPEQPKEDKPHTQHTTMHCQDQQLETIPHQKDDNEPQDIVLSDDDMQIATTDEELDLKIPSPDGSNFL